jgi:23S rRNA pseudouridine2604 synthase
MNERDGDAAGLRLSRRVAAMANCSRREAELLIENGAVRVDGAVAQVIGARVLPTQQVEIEPGAKAVPVPQVTLLLNKPVGTHTDKAMRLFVAANHVEPEREGLRFVARHLLDQKCMTPLESGASGLVVFTQEWRVERKLHEDANVMEHEVMVDVKGAVAPEALAHLQRGAGRVSIGRESEGITGLRFAIKGARPGQIAHLCDEVRLAIVAMKRIRIGRVPLAGLQPGQWRYLLPAERF